MTQTEWNATTDIQRMLEVCLTQLSVSGRKLRLFSSNMRYSPYSEAPHIIRDIVGDPWALSVYETAPVWDGKPQQVQVSLEGALATDGGRRIVTASTEEEAWAAYCETLGILSSNRKRTFLAEGKLKIKDEWKTSTVVGIARHIYDNRADNRAWDDMPILGDTLEDAGCDKVVFLEHCRQTHRRCEECQGKCGRSLDVSRFELREALWEPCDQCEGRGRLEAIHVRGCWLVDMILGME